MGEMNLGRDGPIRNKERSRTCPPCERPTVCQGKYSLSDCLLAETERLFKEAEESRARRLVDECDKEMLDALKDATRIIRECVSMGALGTVETSDGIGYPLLAEYLHNFDRIIATRSPTFKDMEGCDG